MKPLNKAILITVLVSALLKCLFGVNIVAAIAVQTILFGMFIFMLSFVHALRTRNASHGIVQKYKARVAKFRNRAARQK